MMDETVGSTAVLVRIKTKLQLAAAAMQLGFCNIVSYSFVGAPYDYKNATAP
jgi:hypothetical protein